MTIITIIRLVVFIVVTTIATDKLVFNTNKIRCL